MLVESNEIHRCLKNWIIDARTSQMLFSEYKLVVDCIEKMRDILDFVECETTASNLRTKFNLELENKN